MSSKPLIDCCVLESYSFMHNGIKLAGILTRPSGSARPQAQPVPLVVFSHGLLSSKASEKFLYFAPRFAQAGIATFRFDALGCGESGGQAEDTTVTILHQELQAALQFLQTLPYAFSPTGLLGSSIGGFISLWEAAHNAKIAALVTLAAPAVLDFSDREHDDSLKLLKPDFFDDAAHYDLMEALPQVSRVLVLQGDRDTVVPPENAHRIMAGLKAPKRLEMLAGGDHRLNDPEIMARCCALSLQWFAQAFRP